MTLAFELFHNTACPGVHGTEIPQDTFQRRRERKSKEYETEFVRNLQDMMVLFEIYI
jgi:hypothetical protein